MPIRLTLICQAATAATRSAAFPADDALDPAGLARAAALAGCLRRADVAWTSPAQAARQTAEALGLAAAEAPALREIAYGAWAGRSMEDVQAADPAGFATWLEDPGAAPHGGESLAAAIARVAAWLAGLDAQTALRAAAVTHASVIRAAIVTALAAPAAAFWRIDAAPLCRLELHGRGGVWTLRSLSRSDGRGSSDENLTERTT